MKFDLEKMKVKIAALLAKAERTENADEREAFTEKAEALMVRLGIAKAELEAVGERKADPIVERKVPWTGNYAIVMVPFTVDVANGFGDLVILQSMRSYVRRWSYVIGHETDVETFLELLNSLHLQAMRSLKEFQRENRYYRGLMTGMQRYVQSRSFIQGFGIRVGERLYATRNRETQEASPGAALVLASKKDRVSAKVAEMYPNMRKRRTGSSSYDPLAGNEGYRAGAYADLGSTRIDGKKELE